MLGMKKALMKWDADSAENWLEDKSFWSFLKVKNSVFNFQCMN